MKLKKFRNSVLGAALIATAFVLAPQANAQTQFVGGAAMSGQKNIVENAANSPIHKTLVAAVTAAGLVDTLASPGPFTVFAPIDAGFAALPAGTVETLLKPENKHLLVKVLTAHVVPGNVSAAALGSLIRENGGSVDITTVSGDTITARSVGLAISLTDESGGTSFVLQPDVAQSNGVIHVVSNVLVPK